MPRAKKKAKKKTCKCYNFDQCIEYLHRGTEGSRRLRRWRAKKASTPKFGKKAKTFWG